MLTTAAIGFTSASMTTFAQTGNILLDEEKVITDIKPTDVIFWTANSAISYSPFQNKDQGISHLISTMDDKSKPCLPPATMMQETFPRKKEKLK